jgi:pimeloyl-ACP methyl ester carboxylesterase
LVVPAVGDVLLYQSRGESIRRRIRESMPEKGPVVLLGHSLGGVACVDLLVQAELPQVELLITVGSQAPFFYEMDALPSLQFGHPLPHHFPRWLNVYDPRDFLSYVASPVFTASARGISDVRVDNRQPFARAHSAYWANPQTWDAIAPALPEGSPTA